MDYNLPDLRALAIGNIIGTNPQSRQVCSDIDYSLLSNCNVRGLAQVALSQHEISLESVPEASPPI